MPPRCLVLDLDGTLIDSVPDLTPPLNRVLAAHGLPPLTEAEVVPLVGDGARVLVERAMVKRGAQASDADVAMLVDDYTAHAAERTRLYPGVAEQLARLRGEGWRIAVCTNKPQAAARAVLDALGLGDAIDAIGGGDSFPVRKPDPAHLRATLAAAGGEASHAAMIGDHHNDVAAATGAGVPCVFAGWGYGPHTMAEGAEAIAADFAEAVRIAERLVPAT